MELGCGDMLSASNMLTTRKIQSGYLRLLYAKVGKITMFCYGKKESWYEAKVPSGMLPALELDGKLITESDVILHALESTFGALHRSMVRVTRLWPPSSHRLINCWSPIQCI